MIKLSKITFIIGLIFTVFASPVNASDTKQAKLVKIVEDYFANLKTLEADMVQVNPNRSVAKGKFYMLRPKKFRLQYKEPKEHVILSDGKTVIEFEPKENIANYISLDSTPAGLIFRKQVKLSGDVTVKEIEEISNGIRATITYTKEPELGSMTMVLQYNPTALVYWMIRDAQGNITEVALNNIKQGKPVNERLFQFRKKV